MRHVFKKFFVATGIICIFSACSFFSDIEIIDSLTQVQKKLQMIDAQTLVVLDMDDTLISPSENMFHLTWRNPNDFDTSDIAFIKQLRTKFAKIATEKNASDYFNKFVSAVFAKTAFSPVESSTVSIVKDMQKRGIKVIALTASNTGEFGAIENMQQWRVDNLKEVGLDFSNSFAGKEIIFKDLPAQFGFHPVFYKGILCAARNPKGLVLRDFIDRIDWKPSKVIFFDDSYQHCKSVGAEMKKVGIPVQCYWYTASTKNKIKLNQKIIKNQFEHWIKHEEFLPAKEAVGK